MKKNLRDRGTAVCFKQHLDIYPETLREKDLRSEDETSLELRAEISKNESVLITTFVMRIIIYNNPTNST
jgi:hypothetical protein